MGDTAAYKQQSGAGAGRRKGGPGGGGECGHAVSLPGAPPPALPPFLRPQGDLSFFDQGSQCAPPPPASCDFDTVAWRGQLSMTVTPQPSEDGARRSQPAPETPATQCDHSHGLQGMLGSCQLLTPEDNLAHTWIPVWCWL